ncbi:MAG: porphobilinogen synthase [bacterium]
MTDSSFPSRRMRRNRFEPGMRRMMCETRLGVEDLIQPLFVKEGLKQPEPIESMPNQYQHTVDSLVEEIQRCEETGVPGVILFGVPEQKDARGSSASRAGGIIQRALREARKHVDDTLLIADVCLCEYTDHGHCGIVNDGEIVNDETLERLQDVAVSAAGAGADVIAPSDMMDGRVGAIREALDSQGHQRVPIMSYAVKYHSAFYGPFRDAAESAPGFGDRRTYQMDPANRQEALKEAELDVNEGADWLMVKPALPYLDIIREVDDAFDLPLAAYCVSGEFGMIESAAEDNKLDRADAIHETLLGIKRAGADVILTYWAKEVAESLQVNNSS